MIFAETPRLYLRALEETDLPRLAELIGDWDVIKWMLVVPHPYALKDAEEFYQRQHAHYDAGKPEFFAITDKTDRAFMGGVGLHPDYVNPQPHETVLGYWLGKPYWNQGYMSEAAGAVIDIAFSRPATTHLVATTDPANRESQNVLRKAGLNYLGIFPRVPHGLRGGPEETRWELTRGDYVKKVQPL